MDREKVIKSLKWFRDRDKWREGIMIHDDHAEVRKQILDNAIELLKEQEWNLLTEDDEGIIHGLPGDDGQYLMTDGRDIWIDDYMDGVDDGIFLDSGRDVREIKAWMPMPKPYKSE